MTSQTMMPTRITITTPATKSNPDGYTLRLPFRQQCLIVDRIMLDPVQVQLLELEIHRRSLPQLNAAHTSLFSCDSPRRLKPIRCAFYSGGVLVSAVLGTSPT